MATERLQVYKCGVCGIVAEVLDGGAGELVCCGQPMRLFEPNTVDASKEKHVPVLKAEGSGCSVTIGSVPHPMEEKHFIQWIEVIADGKSYRQFLKPGQKPDAAFPVEAKNIVVREFCNLHGLWKTQA
jgi:superoxide reductase